MNPKTVRVLSALNHAFFNFINEEDPAKMIIIWDIGHVTALIQQEAAYVYEISSNLENKMQPLIIENENLIWPQR